MAIFGNFKGTTKSEFQIGKNAGNKISTSVQPSSDLSNGDLYIDSGNSTLQVYDSGWKSIGETLTSLNVDSGTLFVDSSNDTVSIGSTSSNEKLFVNGNLRLGTNPSLQYSGAYLDLKHSNGSGSVIRVRDNNTGTDPIFKIYNANNTSEVFKVEGSNTTINGITFPATDGTTGQVVTTDGNGTLSFTTVNATPGGSNTQIQFNNNGSFEGSSGLTFDDTTDTLETGVVRGVLFEPITDYGLITSPANITIDYGAVTDSATAGDFEFLNDTFGPTGDTFTVAKVPSAAQPGQMIFISDETGGPVMAFSDGTNWRRITDRAIISS